MEGRENMGEEDAKYILIMGCKVSNYTMPSLAENIRVKKKGIY
jgi:hypothetical protein